MMKYNEYFGFKTEPFMNSIPTTKLLKLPDMISVQERMDYTLSLGGVMALTGDVGSGKSTSIRWALSHYHPSEVLILNVIANSGSVSELYKQICWALDIEIKSSSRSYLQKRIRSCFEDIAASTKTKKFAGY